MSDLIRNAEVLNTPVQSRYLNDISRHKNDNLAWCNSIFKLDPRVELMAYKKCEQGNGSVVRILNNRDDDVAEVILTLSKDKQCYLANVQEEKLEKLENENGQILIKNIMANTFITVIIE